MPIKNPSYFQKLIAVVGEKRFWRRSRIYSVIWEGFVPERTKVLSEIKKRVREMEEEELWK